MKSNKAIGIFDSGIGGLTIAKAIKNIMPHESIIYFADLKHLPYGDKSKDIIIEYSKRITTFLLLKQCKAIVIACNTASANALKEVKNLAYNRALVFDVITPVINTISYQRYRKIGVIATQSTINSHIYKKNITKLNSDIKIFELATPLLAPIIEKGFYNHKIYHVILKKYLSNFKFIGIDSLILGCTHYPLIIYEISSFFDHLVTVINSAKIVADNLLFKLRNNNLLYQHINPEYHFYFSDESKSFKKTVKIMFGNKIIFNKVNMHILNNV